ncbi:beta strand repeat-containing protein [Flavobacterium sp. 3HN19-14]|uniref:beta strand repeat-containing protein n=1 Tax=Flavobacterium sp. 3HN19-14 TaxID=3448133 RepID=UPI003EE39D4C
MTQTTQFRAVVQSGACPEAASSATTVTINSGPLAVGNYAIPGCFATVAAAVNYINTNGTSGTGTVQFDIAAGHTETAPAGGFNITATGTATRGIAFVKSGAGANPTFTASPSQTVGSVSDAVFKLVGADYITLDGLTMQENAANTVSGTAATNNMTEFGVALLYASLTDGAQNNTIKNNTISLNRTYLNTFGIYSNTRHSATVMTTAAEVTAASGSNSNNKVYTNAISNVNYGVVFIGAGTTLAAIDNGNDIGGASPVTGNTITNWGGGSALTAYTSLITNNYGIIANQQINDNISYNTVISAALATAITPGGIAKLYSVASPTSGTITSTINNNTVAVTNNPTAAAIGVIGINNQGLTPLLASATMSINDNTVQNCVLGGSTVTTGSITAITNASIPGTLNMNGNTVVNNAITATSSTSGINAGIANSGAAGTVNINNNIVRSLASTATTGQVQGIINTGAVVTALNINNNQLGNTTSGLFSTSTATSGGLFGIASSAGAGTCALSITGNDVRGITYNVAATAANTYISNTGITLSQNISNNTFTNLNVNTTGSVTFISNSVAAPAAGFKTINGNSIVTGFNKGGAGGTIALYNDGASSVCTTPVQNNNNNFSNITVTGATTITGWFNNDGTGATPAKTITGNTFSNWTGGTSSIIVLQSNFGGSNTMSGNTISNITGQAAVTGILVGSSGTIANLSVASNTVTGLSSTGTGGTVIGISNAVAGSSSSEIASNTVRTLSSTGASAVTGITASASTNILKNKISDLSGSNASSTVNGIVASSGTDNISNNLIGDLRTPVANAANPLNGINITGGTTMNVYFNTIYLNGSSSGALFGSSAISASTTPNVTLRNNIFANASTPAGAGLAVAYRRSSTTLTSYNSASNNNLLFGSAIYTDGTNTDATLAAYKSRVGSRDVLSFSENPASLFVSTSGASASFLHINPATPTGVESGGTTISGFATDFDGDTRNATTPDVGADEGNFLLSDTFG